MSGKCPYCKKSQVDSEFDNDACVTGEPGYVICNTCYDKGYSLQKKFFVGDGFDEEGFDKGFKALIEGK